jgi:hypothetical protein
VEWQFVNNHYVLNSLNATFCIICEHRFQQDQCLWTVRATMLGCLLRETRSCRKNRNMILRNGDVFQWKPMLLKLHSRWCRSSTPHWRANNALAMRFSVCLGTLLLLNRAWCSLRCWSSTQHWRTNAFAICSQFLQEESLLKAHRIIPSLGVLVNAVQSVNALQSVFCLQMQ